MWLDRLSEWLEPFEVCFTHVAQRGAFRRYLLGLLSDSRRKSMSAMLERVTDPGTYQSFQHFITHAPWSAERVWRRLRQVIPEREGVLILDGTSFPKQGPHSVGVARQYLRQLGQSRQLPGRGDHRPVDRYARMDAECRDVSPRGVADVGGPTACANSTHRALPGKVAAGPDAAATDSRERISPDGGRRRCRIRRQRHAAPGAASCQAALCPRCLVGPEGLFRDAAPHPATAVAGPGPGAHSARAGARRAHRHGRRPGGRTARARLAARQLAQRRERPLAGGLCRASRDARTRLAATATTRVGSVGARGTRFGGNTAHQVPTWSICR